MESRARDVLNSERHVAQGHLSLAVDNLCVTYSDDEQAVVKGVTFGVTRGEVLGLIGPPAAGKSTLLKALCGLNETMTGDIRWGDMRLGALHPTRWSVWRQRIGMAFQNSALFDAMTVFENVAFPLRRRQLSDEVIAEKVHRCLRAVGLEDAAQKMPRELSGGMQKRVGIARAAAGDPEIGLFDDPTAGLDPQTARAILALITMLTREQHMATMVVSNDLGTLLPICDRVMMLDRGHVVYLGSVDGLEHAQSAVVRQFVLGLDVGPL